MNYLDNYLNIIPEYDANEIRKALKENELNLGLETISEYEFENLISKLSEESAQMTSIPEFQDKIKSDELNRFYSSLSLDLKRLFSKQESIEMADENYHHIYQSTLEEISRAVETLRRHIETLKYRKNKEKGLVVKSYGFEPENEIEYKENYNQDTMHLFIDRDGTSLLPAESHRFYHNYSLTLAKKEEENILINDNNISTATVEVLYETPGTLTNSNPSYDISNTVDGTNETFWFNVVLKSNTDLDKVSISPKAWG